MEITSTGSAFPKLTPGEMDVIRANGERRAYADGEAVFRAGDADIDFFVVESGGIRIVNPTADGAEVVVHGPGEFAGDIDLLTRRPVIVTGFAKGADTVLLRVPGARLRHLLHTVPRLSEKLIVAFSVRREMLEQSGVLGMKVVGPGRSPETGALREFLYKNFVPSTFYDTDTDDGRAQLAAMGKTLDDTPVVECGGAGELLSRPTLGKLARCVGVHPHCPQQVFDLAIVGSGPAGMTAAVYAASEALSCVVLDRVGPGGQAGGSSMIENFIGFPSGLSGIELATRGVLQMMKFGALLLTPVRVKRVLQEDHFLRLETDDGDDVRARCVLASTGARWRKLAARNADRFERAGIYYAATSVEARVCEGQPVAVVGAGNSAGQAAMFLSECTAHVHMVIRGTDLGKGMSDYLVERIRENDRITMHTETEVEAVLGDARIEGVEAVHNPTGERVRIDCTALFVFIGAEPYADWLPDDVARDDLGYILTGADAKRSGRWRLDREPCTLETTVPRLLAAGDVRSGSTKRVAFAVGDGAMAVTCVHRLRGLQT